MAPASTPHPGGWARISLQSAYEAAGQHTMLGRLQAVPFWCPACQQERPHACGLVCRECWTQLPEATRTALLRPDDAALRRARQLLAALRAKTPLAQLAIG